MEDKIEVGVITCGNRPIHEYGCDVGIFTDTEKRGASYAKNRLIKKFYDECKGHIFIFDDDAYPVIDGWKEKIIDWCTFNKVHYLGGIDLKNANIISAHGDILQIASPYIGAFYYMDRECIEKVGYYNEKYGRYGWEDVEYSNRVNKCFGLNDSYPYPSWMNMYLHSEDMFEENPIQNMNTEEKMKCIKEGENECVRMINEISKGNWYIGYGEIRINT